MIFSEFFELLARGIDALQIFDGGHRGALAPDRNDSVCCRKNLLLQGTIAEKRNDHAEDPNGGEHTRVARSTRFKTLARELLPLAPSAARSCKMTWLKIWLRKSHCVAFLDSPARTFCVAVCQPCVWVFVKSSACMMDVAFAENERAGAMEVFEAITVPPRGAAASTSRMPVK